MKTFENTSEELAVQDACQAFGIDKDSLIYTVTDVEKGGFIIKKVKKVTISCPDLQDLFYDVGKYITSILSLSEIKATYSYSHDASTDIVVFSINPENEEDSKKIIGYKGNFLSALTVLCRRFIYKKYNHQYRILLDCEGYKNKKYDRITRIARSVAREVQRTHVDAELEPMTSDERRIVHNIVSKINYVDTQSAGFGKFRHVVISYNASKVVDKSKNNDNFRVRKLSTPTKEDLLTEDDDDDFAFESQED